MGRFTAAIAGVIFAVGLVVGGMTLPSKVIGFLDVFGAWDPSLAFVMGGAMAVHALVLFATRSRPAPACGDRFHPPTRTRIEPRLVVGGALFGAGWGLAGFCPGPALVSLATLSVPALVFGAAMFAGMFSYECVLGDWAERLRDRSGATEPSLGGTAPPSRAQEAS